MSKKQGNAADYLGQGIVDRRSISVVIPAFNEEERISSTVHKVYRYLKEQFASFEIIVVSDGSTDHTDNIVASLIHGMPEVKLLKQTTNVGKGSSMRKGVFEATSDFILMSDADLSSPIEELAKLFTGIESGADIAIGSRWLPESDIMQRQSWQRETMGRIYNTMVRWLFVQEINDTQCGFKLFKTNVAKQLFNKSRINGFSFDVEILFLAKRMGFHTRETPVRWADNPNSKVGVFFDPLHMVWDLLRIRWYDLTGRY